MVFALTSSSLPKPSGVITSSIGDLRISSSPLEIHESGNLESNLQLK